MTVNDWIPNPGTGDNPVRKGETLTGLRFRNGSESVNGISGAKWSWSEEGQYTITHYRVTPPRTAAPIAEPTTMSADEVLIRAREAVIESKGWPDTDHKNIRGAINDHFDVIQAIIAYERDRAKPLAEVAPHTAEDPDDRVAYDMYRATLGAAHSWEERENSPWYRSLRVALKRGRELERGE